MRSGQLRQAFSSGELVRFAGAHNALTARLVQEAGFHGVWASGLEISASLGLPDENLLTMTELLNVAANTSVAVSLPVLVDCENGFGGRANVMRTVTEFERRGITAISIDDTLFPRTNSFAGKPIELISAIEFEARIRTASSARDPNKMLVIARIEAFVAGLDLNEVLLRSQAAERGGADALIVHSNHPTAAEILNFLAHWDGGVPVGAIPTSFPNTSLAQLHHSGLSFVIHANHGIRAAIKTIRNVLRKLKAADVPAVIDDDIITIRDLFHLQKVGWVPSDNG